MESIDIFESLEPIVDLVVPIENKNSKKIIKKNKEVIKKVPKYSRIKWKDYEEEVLSAIYYKTNGLPSLEDLSSLAVILNTNVKRVRHWFQNKRQRKNINLTNSIITDVFQHLI